MSIEHLPSENIRALILFSQPWRVGGAESHLQTLVGSLKDRGVEVIIVGLDVAISKQFAGLTIYQLPLRSSNPFVLLHNYQRLKQIIQKHSITVLHAHQRTGSIYGWLLRHALSLPYLVTFHDKWRPLHRLYKPFLPPHCIAISNGVNAHFTTILKVAPQTITVVENGVVVSAVTLSQAAGENSILCVSRFNRYKSVVPSLLCQIAETLNNRFPTVKILLVGQGPKEEEVKVEVQNANAACKREAVFFLGPRSDVLQLLANSTIAVGAGRFALEAMAAGKPVIAMADGKDYPGIISSENWLQASKTSWTRGKEALNADNLLTDITTILQNKSLQDKLGKFGRDLISATFSAERMADRTIQMYEKARKGGL